MLKSLGASTAALLAPASKSRAAFAPDLSQQLGVLVDTTLCVGCRACEKACNRVNTDLPPKPDAAFKDAAETLPLRRMEWDSYTVVNHYAASAPVFVKFQCMHCLYPACESACIVGAFTREPSGAVIYDAWKCIGCRYCMAACPFQVPAYEYGNAFTPQVRKCTFCFDTRLQDGGLPACVQACPMQVMTFGPRAELLRMGREKINAAPDRYLPHIYGEKEAGGTSWMYLAGVPFTKLGLPRLGYHPLPGYTEPIQHALFKWFLPPLGLYAALGGIMWLKKRSERKHSE